MLSIYRIPDRFHKLAMTVFMVVIVTHLIEHLSQAYQLWGLGWERPRCMGFLGLWKPWLMRGEWLHYAHALFMLLGYALFLPMFWGTAARWWLIGFGLQFFHHFEHALLLGQAITGVYLFGGEVPTSIGQIWFPRLELHLFYVVITTIPMVVALYLHRFPNEQAKGV